MRETENLEKTSWSERPAVGSDAHKSTTRPLKDCEATECVCVRVCVNQQSGDGFRRNLLVVAGDKSMRFW